MKLCTLAISCMNRTKDYFFFFFKKRDTERQSTGEDQRPRVESTCESVPAPALGRPHRFVYACHHLLQPLFRESAFEAKLFVETLALNQHFINV